MELVDANQIAEMLKLTERYVKERLIFKEDFPLCFKLSRTCRLWNKDDINEWVLTYRQKP